MPIYTYRCENCGVQFDQKQKFVDNPLVTCPECGKKALRKVYQPVGIVFKGSGFYATDHRSPSGGYPSSSKEEKPPSSEKAAVPAESTTSSAESSNNEKSKETTSTTPAAK
jgi:putative FmdB family regulatory protein